MNGVINWGRRENFWSQAVRGIVGTLARGQPERVGQICHSRQPLSVGPFEDASRLPQNDLAGPQMTSERPPPPGANFTSSNSSSSLFSRRKWHSYSCQTLNPVPHTGATATTYLESGWCGAQSSHDTLKKVAHPAKRTGNHGTNGPAP